MRPWPIKPRSVGVAPAEGVCARERDDLVVTEAHTAEHLRGGACPVLLVVELELDDDTAR